MPQSFFPNADAATRVRLDANPTISLANAFDWGRTDLGPVAGWPEALKAAVRLILSSDAPMVMMVGRSGVLIYNQGYADFAGAKHPHIFGMPALEAWPEIADFNRGNIERGLRGESWYLADQELLLDRTGTLERAYMNLNYSPVLGDDGVPLAVLVIVVETTSGVLARRSLEQSEQSFRVLADTMPQMVWSTQPDGFHDYYNARWYEFTGMKPGTTDGEGWNDVFHPEDRQRAWEVWRHSLTTGEPYYIEYRLRHHTGEYRWVIGRALPMRDASGTIVRWFGTCTDFHESRQLADERAIVAQELSHRIKNIFAVISGIISLSARSYPEMRGLADGLRERIFSLGKAHDFIRPHSSASRPHANPSSLFALIGELLGPYQTGAERLVFTGDDGVIDDGAATPLVLLFHELATNSAKYGALSVDGGTIVISGEKAGDRYRLSWKEQGGPPVSEPTVPLNGGFGSRLIQLSVEGQMRGTVVRVWEPDGLLVKVDVPVDALNRSAQLRL